MSESAATFEHLRTSAIRVTEESHRIVVRERQLGGFLLGAAFLLSGVVFYALSLADLGWVGDEAEAFGLTLFARWGGIVITAASLLLLGILAVRAVRRPLVIDGGRGRIEAPGRTVELLRATRAMITQTRVLEQIRYNLVVAHEGGELPIVRLLDARHLEALRALRDRIQPWLAGPLASAADDEGPEAIEQNDDFGRSLVATGLGAVGAVWATSGYLLMPGVLLTPGAGASFGFLLWPLGIWIAALGALEWLRVPLFDWLRRPPLWRRALILALWLGSYMALCVRQLA